MNKSLQRRSIRPLTNRILALCALATGLALTGCEVGPHFHRPVQRLPGNFSPSAMQSPVQIDGYPQTIQPRLPHPRHGVVGGGGQAETSCPLVADFS